MAPATKYRLLPCPTCHTPGQRRVIDGAYLRRRRERVGVSVRHLARALDIAPQFLSRIERNQVPCPARIQQAYESLHKGVAV